MSRIRSQLDSLLNEPRQPAGRAAPQASYDDYGNGLGNPAAPRSHAQNQELDRIRNIIDQLASRIGSGNERPAPRAQRQEAPGPASMRAQPPRPQAPRAQSPRPQPARAETPRYEAPRHDPYGSHSAPGRAAARPEPARRPIENELEGLRQQLGDFVTAFSQGRHNEKLHDDIHQLAESMARLEERVAATPDQLGDLSADLHALREFVADQSRRPAPSVDIAPLQDTIETGNAQLLARLEDNVGTWFDRMSRDQDQTYSHLGELAARLETLHHAIGHLPAELPVGALQQRLEDLAYQIEQLASAGNGSQSQDFAALNDRLDDIVRAMAAMVVEPNTDAFDRIEARLATLARTVEAIAEEQAAMQVNGGFSEEILSALEAIDARLNDLGQHAPAASVDLEPIVERLAFLSEKIDNLPALGSAAAQIESDPRLLMRIEEIAGRLDALAGETIRAGHDEEIVTLLHGLADRIDELAAKPAANLPDPNQIAALEGQLASIISQIGSIPASGLDLKPIADRLDSIEQQVANSRDIAIEVASEAAERAVGLAGQSFAGQSTGINADLIEKLRDELRQLDTGKRDVSSENIDALRSVHEALSAIADRLGQIETRIGNAATETRNENELERRPFESDEIDEPEDAPEPNPVLSRLTARLSRASHETPTVMPVSDHDMADDRDAELMESDAREDIAILDEVPSLDSPAAEPEPAIDDVPLEPGSGAPDFVELVRQASAKRKAGEATAKVQGANELIAAARRAAQAAQQESRPVEVQPEVSVDADAVEKAKQEPRKKAARTGGLGALLGKHRRSLLMATTAIAIVVVGIPIATRFISPTHRVAQVPDSPAATQTTEQTPAIAADQPVRQIETADATSLPVNGAADRAPSPTAEASAQSMDSDANEPGAMTTDATDGAAADTAMDAAGSDDVAMADTATAEVTATDTSTETAADAAPTKPQPGQAITAAPMPPAEVGNVALRQAAADGNALALFEVARRYTDGDVVERDLDKAAEWYERAARAGLPVAQYRLANFFEKGRGVTVDLKTAAMWYQRAAEQGNALAMHNLGVLYTSGVVDEGADMAAAVQWFTKAADLGVKDSQVNLGILYARGMGVDENLVEAYKWFAIAAQGGDQDAATKRDTLANAMRPDQLTKARGLVQLWKPKPLDPAANGAEADPAWTTNAGQSANATNAGKTDTAIAATSRQLVQKAQQLLAQRGFDPGPADGLMGAKTRDAVMSFQKDAGMAVDGEVTDDLIRALEKGAA